MPVYPSNKPYKLPFLFYIFFIAYFPQLSPSPMSTLSCHLLVPTACWGAFSGHAASSKQDGGCGPKYIHGCLGRSCLCSCCTSTQTQGLRRRRLETCRNDTVAVALRIANHVASESCSMCRIVLQKSFMVLQGLANFFRESRSYARHSIDGMRAEAPWRWCTKQGAH